MHIQEKVAVKTSKEYFAESTVRISQKIFTKLQYLTIKRKNNVCQTGKADHNK